VKPSEQPRPKINRKRLLALLKLLADKNISPKRRKRILSLVSDTVFPRFPIGRPGWMLTPSKRPGPLIGPPSVSYGGPTGIG